MASYKVGGETDVFCTRCKLLLAHTILAMEGGRPARVKCNTCHTDRSWRNPEGSTPRPRRDDAEPARPGRAGVVRESDFDRLMKGRDFSKNQKYSIKTAFKLEDIVDHPQFGLGLVTALKGPDKVEVLFKDGPKTLVHNKGAPPPA